MNLSEDLHETFYQHHANYKFRTIKTQSLHLIRIGSNVRDTVYVNQQNSRVLSLCVQRLKNMQLLLMLYVRVGTC